MGDDAVACYKVDGKCGWWWTVRVCQWDGGRHELSWCRVHARGLLGVNTLGEGCKGLRGERGSGGRGEGVCWVWEAPPIV